MIIDRLENLVFYKPMIKNLDNALEAINNVEKMEVGRYEFEGGFFSIQKGVTNLMSEGTYEAHKKYIDIHIIVEGSEELAWAPLANLTEVTAYDEEKDMAEYTGALSHVIKATAGMCYVAYPLDGHMPIRHVNEAQSYTKIVVKLPVE